VKRILALKLAFVGVLYLCGPDGCQAQSMSGEIDAATALQALPYAYMSNDAYNNPGSALPVEWRRLPFDWEAVLQRGGMSIGQTALLKNLYFSADLYRNDNTKEIVVAFRGTDTKNLETISKELMIEQTKIQYKASAALVEVVKQLWLIPQSSNGRPLAKAITLTGHSFGGALASYAGSVTGISSVYTFNAYRTPLAEIGSNPNQINVYDKHDWIGNPNVKNPIPIEGEGKLPGKSVSIKSTTELSDPHNIQGIIEALKASQPKKNVNLSAAELNETTRAAPPLRQPAVQPSTFSQQPLNSASGGRPVGGISLSRAAAKSMPLNLTLDGSYYSDGRIVLMGRRDAAHSIDAALFFTALRLACDGSDPYFSLDPVEGASWNAQGEQAVEAFWSRIASTFERQPDVRRKDSLFFMRTISARRDFPQVWKSMEARYPDLKSKLVFRPLWLEETRFGEVLYKADVLLKELSAGVPLLTSGPMRAATVPGYISSHGRSVARRLLDAVDGQEARVNAKPAWQGHRMWFDVASFDASGRSSVQERAGADYATRLANPCIGSKPRCELWKKLQEQRLLPSTSTKSISRTISSDGDALDLSNVYPRMFTVRHDHVTRTDLPGNDPDENSLAADVSARMEEYGGAYEELGALIDVFRAYVAAVHIASADRLVCPLVRAQPLLDSERVRTPLPAYHPSELFIAHASFEYTDGRYRRLYPHQGFSVSGGVSIHARAYMHEALRPGVTTEITKIVRQEAALPRTEPMWQSNGNRQFVALRITPRDEAE
jgi:hypothetical protein